MQNILKLDAFKKENFWLRTCIVVPATIIMGFALSWLLLVNLGTDPCTMMNNAISSKIGWSLGNWQALLNVILLVFVIIFGGRNLGIGTISNMFLVGYSFDFFSWVWQQVLPEGAFESWTVRIIVLFPAVIVFVLAAATYMVVDMGTSPYDAISIIVSSHIKKVPFRVVRITYDFLVIGIGFCFGGKIQIVTVIMAITLGPVVGWLGSYANKLFPQIFGGVEQ